MLHTKSITPIVAGLLTPAAMIHGCVESKKGLSNWKSHKVIACDGRIARARSAAKGPTTLLAIEDARLQPTNAVARQVVEEELGVMPAAALTEPEADEQDLPSHSEVADWQQDEQAQTPEQPLQALPQQQSPQQEEVAELPPQQTAEEALQQLAEPQPLAESASNNLQVEPAPTVTRSGRPARPVWLPTEMRMRRRMTCARIQLQRI